MKKIYSISKTDFQIAKSLLNDLIIKSSLNKNNANDFKLLKLLKAREENIDFELELAERICGDNNNFPYRSSYYLTKFFSDLGFDFTHTGETRRFWVQNVLKQLNIREISLVIENGLFRKKDFKNPKLRTDLNKEILDEDFIKRAITDFKEFIDDSLSFNESIDLLEILDLNINIELLFDKKASTKDNELNDLIEEAKSRFLNPNDKQIAVEKLWDAFERLKTFYNSGKKKSESAEFIVQLISSNFDQQFIENEFRLLTEIGNNYRIRHHETNKIEIKEIKHLNYLFFRMLSLIDLCLVNLNE